MLCNIKSSSIPFVIKNKCGEHWLYLELELVVIADMNDKLITILECNLSSIIAPLSPSHG